MPGLDHADTAFADEALTAAEATVSTAAATSTEAGEAPPPADDERDHGMVLWGLAGVAGATGLALVGRGGGATTHDPVPVPPSGTDPTPGGVEGPTPGDGTGAAGPGDDDGTGSRPDQGADEGTLPPGGTDGNTDPVGPPRPGRLALQMQDTGASALDRVTASQSLTLGVEGQDAGTQVRYQRSVDGGQSWEDCPAQLDGLPDGDHLLRAVVSHAGGEATTDPVSITVDRTAPAAGSLTVDGDTHTGSFRLSLQAAEPGSTRHYELSQDNGVTWVRTSALQHGLADGQYLFRGVATDLAGNQSVTAAQAVTVDTEPPAAVALQLRKVGEQGVDAVGPLSCTGDIDLVLDLPAGVTAVYEWSTNGGLAWVPIDPSVRGLAEGTHTFRAVLQDLAGNRTELGAVSLTVDKTLPPAFSITALDNGNPDDGYFNTDGSLQFALSIPPVNVQVVYEYRLEGSADWKACSGSVSGVLDGRYEVRAYLEDMAGNRRYSKAVLMEVDTRRPGAGTINLDNFTDTGDNGWDRITTDDRFDLVHVASGPVSSVVWQVSTNGGGSWRPTTASQVDLVDGRYQYRALVTDDQGQTFVTRTIDVTIDSRPPSVPTLGLSGFDDTGASGSDGITQNGNFEFVFGNVASDAYAYVEVSVDGGVTWMTTGLQQDLNPGQYWFRAVSVDQAGGRGVSQAVQVTVDREAPAVGRPQLKDFTDTGLAGDRLTSDTSFTLVADGLEAGATVRFWHSTDLGQSWTLTPALQANLTDGVHWFRTEVTDVAGNVSTGQALEVTIDTTAPDAGQLVVNGQGSSLDLHLAGAEGGATVQFEVSLDSGQHWLPVLAHTDGLPQGDYLFRAVVSDGAGNTAMTSAVGWQVPPRAEAGAAADAGRLLAVDAGEESGAYVLAAVPWGTGWPDAAAIPDSSPATSYYVL